MCSHCSPGHACALGVHSNGHVSCTGDIKWSNCTRAFDPYIRMHSSSSCSESEEEADEQRKVACEECGKEAKYTCPRCQRRSCSLGCVTAHKNRDGCRCGIVSDASSDAPGPGLNCSLPQWSTRSSSIPLADRVHRRRHAERFLLFDGR